MDGDLVVNRKKKLAVVEELRSRKYEAFFKNAQKNDHVEDEEEGEDGANDDDGGNGGYDYLLSVSYWTQTSTECH